MALTFTTTPLFTAEEFNEAWPELDPLEGILYTIRYGIADKLFCGFSGVTDEEAQCTLMLLAVAHVHQRLCDPDLVNPVKELRSMESAEKYEVPKRDMYDLGLIETIYGKMILDYANMDYNGGMSVSLRQEGCYSCFGGTT